MNPRHCSDERLLCHLDGELSPWADKLVKRHLRTCWWCRFRLAALERQIHAVAEELNDEPFPGPDWVVRARFRFAQWEESFERERRATAQFSLVPNRHASSMRTGMIAAVAGVVILVGFLLYPDHGTRSSPREVLASRLEAEPHLDDRPVHQSIRVEVAQLKPTPQRESVHLQIWSDPRNDRFRSSLQSSDGALIHALWKADEQQFVYNAKSPNSSLKRGESSHRPVSFAELSWESETLEQVEESLIRWLEERDWKPISLTSDLALFSDAEGVVLEAEPVRDADGAQGIRFSAYRRVAGLTVEFVVMSDPNDRNPRVQRIRFETPERAFEVKLVAEYTQAIEPVDLKAALFRPDASLLRTAASRVTLPKRPRAVAPSDAESATRSISAPKDAMEVAVLEVEVLYVLHQLKACLGEPISVVRGPDNGGVLVEGLARTQARKAELLGVLEALGAESLLQVNVRTIQEAAQFDTAISSGVSLPDTTTRMRSTPLPIQGDLERFFAQRHETSVAPQGDESPIKLNEAVTTFSNQAVTIAEASLADAWALRRLAERYSSTDVGTMEPRARVLLGAMIRGHLVDVSEDIARWETLLGPVLESLAGGSADGINALLDSRRGAEDIAIAETSWESVMAIFEAVREMDSLTRTLFVSQGVESETNEGVEVGQLATTIVPEQAIHDLLQAFQGFDQRLRRIDAQVASEFLLNPKVVTLNQQ